MGNWCLNLYGEERRKCQVGTMAHRSVGLGYGYLLGEPSSLGRAVSCHHH